MRGQANGGQKESILIGVGAVAILGVLTWFTMKSPYILHRLDLPLLIAQSKTYSIVSDVYDKEHGALTGLRALIRDEYKKNGYKRIDGGKARKYANNAGKWTILTTKIISVVILLGLFIPFVRYARREKKTVYDMNQYIAIPAVQGIEGFIITIGKYLSPDLLERLRKEPTPENILAAFTIAREKANIPNNLLGRLFPKWSDERVALYGYGKGLVEYDVNANKMNSMMEAENARKPQ